MTGIPCKDPRLSLALHTLCLTALLASTACNASGGGPPSGPLPDSITVQSDLALGQGPFIYTDTSAGLSNLSSYKSSLTLNFEGTVDGKPVTWSRTYTMLATNQPAARQWTIEQNPDDIRFVAEMNGTDYDKTGSEECLASPIKAGDELGSRLELAAFLTGVIGADQAGSETVNGVASDHYTFDERALAQQGLTQSKGELWVASDGGYVVKYVLSSKGKSDYFGQGVEGTLSQDYELTDPQKPVVFQLPADCPPGMVEAPQLPDASHVNKAPGSLSYQSASSVKDAIAFYKKELAGLGWKAQANSPTEGDSGALLGFVRGDEELSLLISADGGTITVTLLEGRAQK